MLVTFGEGTIAHDVPSQCSMSVSTPVLPLNPPTAQQSVAETHVTPNRTLACVGLTLGEATILHELPSHRSINVCTALLALFQYEPTVQHPDSEKQVAPLILLPTVIRL